MKISIIKDKHGKTVASYEAKGGEGKLEPKLQEGQKVEAQEVPEHYISDLKVVYKKAV